MPAKELLCKVISRKWLTPTVLDIRFEPSRKFAFEPGQFISVVIPSFEKKVRPHRRAYSLVLPPHEGYGLCVKMVENGPGSGYIKSLEVGQEFRIFAPYGDFCYNPKAGRAVCFVSTGTGVAPFMAMIRSKAYLDNPPPSAINVFGARTEEEIIFPGLFESLGIAEINAISRPGPSYTGFKGRVTDYLKSLPSDWGWYSTDFYLCGNGDMVGEVRRFLKGSRGVPDAHIHQEVYFVVPDRLGQAPGVTPAQPSGVVRQVTPPPPPAHLVSNRKKTG